MSEKLIDLLAMPDIVGPFTWLEGLILIALAATCLIIVVVDARHQVIPDLCNMSVAALGLAYTGLEGSVSVVAALVQGAVALLMFWIFRALYRYFRGHDGLGLGDVKFLGAAGTWIGLSGLPTLILIACTTALAMLGAARLRGHAVAAGLAIPFGPFLVAGLIGTLVAR